MHAWHPSTRGSLARSARDPYPETMVRRLSVRLAPVTNRAAEYAPMAPACCNVCRTCTTTNVVGLALGGLTAAGVALRNALGRPPKRAG
jgi:hypothetical protein